MDVPPELLREANRAVLAHLEGKSAHPDIVEPMMMAMEPLGDVQFFCPDEDNCHYVLASTKNVILAFATGADTIAFRLDALMKSRALATGGSEVPDCGPGWVSFIPFRDDWPKVDFEFWARKAYVNLRENPGSA